jgi:hypothetical protein
MDHKHIRNKNKLFVGKVEMDIVLSLSLGEELYDVVLQYDDIVFDFQSSKYKFFSFGLTHNWVKLIIL